MDSLLSERQIVVNAKARLNLPAKTSPLLLQRFKPMLRQRNHRRLERHLTVALLHLLGQVRQGIINRVIVHKKTLGKITQILTIRPDTMDTGTVQGEKKTIKQATVIDILTRCQGYLTSVSSHSLQPYRGCTFGNSLCGVGCYVQHNPFITRGRKWGQFLEVRTNAAERYLKTYARERSWAQRTHGRFSIFCSSSTDPFLPQERKFRVTASLLAALCEAPPDELILQTHTSAVRDEAELLTQLNAKTELRVQISIESDRDRLPGLPPPACSVERRLEACRDLKQRGLNVIVCVAPLLPIEHPERFFTKISEVANAVIIDHFIKGDGTNNGSRTRRTALVDAMCQIEPNSDTLAYRDKIIEVARSVFPGRVGVGKAGFAGEFG